MESKRQKKPGGTIKQTFRIVRPEWMNRT